MFNELAHLESRHILFSIIKEPKSILEISKEMKIPLSSAYKQIQSLKDCFLIIEKKDFAESGHITTFYQSVIKDVKISITKFEPSISFTKNEITRK
ncbi:MAG: winged helix-turn-helix transcriptional regulator [Nitrosopumilus sp.]|nr:winged helix-turn-helix domain-containing protein [Nitrosopumilus sp.]NND87273.1 winged helix-turn-helix transcriptional regulator [Nitrosopumilus sp.]